MAVIKQRRSSSLLRFTSGSLGALKSSVLPKVDYRSNFQQSFSQPSRIPVQELRNIAENLLVQKAISRISNGVLAMPWQILPPKEDVKKESAQKRAQEIRRALLRPVVEGDHNTYSKFVRAAIAEILTIGFVPIERYPGSEDTQPFWLYLADGSKIRANSSWTPQTSGVIPRYYQTGLTKDEWVPFLSKEMFIVQMRSSAYQLVPASPVATIYKLMSAWLGVGKFQDETVKRGVRGYLISIEEEELTEEELEQFRIYWRNNVEGKGEIPILAGKIKKTDLTSKTDDELYPRYTEYLLRLVALGFDMASRDFNIAEPDNKATAEVSSDQTFAQAILPMAMCFKEHLGEEVVDFYEPGFRLEYADTEPRGQKEESDIAVSLFGGGVITRNEARVRVGEDSVSDGDKFNDATSSEAKAAKPPLNEEDKPTNPANTLGDGGEEGVKPQKKPTQKNKKAVIQAEQLILL